MLPERAPLGAVDLPPGWSLRVVAQTGSTNADLLAAADRTPHGSVLVVEHQTAGRGRLDRTWTSPPRSGLTFSVLVRPGTPVATWGWLPLLAGVALRDAVAPLVEAFLKWPNDLLVGAERRKAAGILVQVSGDTAVIGIGLNVSTTADELPVPSAASLTTAGAAVPDRAALLATILARLASRYAQWRDAGGDAQACGLAVDYARRCATLGQTVSVATGDGGSFAGVASGLDAEGRLRVAERIVAAGDIEHVRPAGR